MPASQLVLPKLGELCERAEEIAGKTGEVRKVLKGPMEDRKTTRSGSSSHEAVPVECGAVKEV